MGCLELRSAISARLDGEDRPGEAETIDAHVAACPDCARYAEQAARVTRLTRTRPAEAGPDLVAAVLAAAPRPRRRRGPAAVRVALGAVSLGQFGLALAGIVGGGGHDGAAAAGGATMLHIAHETAAWNLALAIGFLWVAIGASRTSGLVPMVGGFVVVLLGLSVLDLVSGAVAPGRLLSHGLVVVGLVLLLVLRRFDRDGDGRGGRRRPAEPLRPGSADYGGRADTTGHEAA